MHQNWDLQEWNQLEYWCVGRYWRRPYSLPQTPGGQNSTSRTASEGFQSTFFHSSLLLSSEASMRRYNCMVPFNILVQLCCRWLIFQSSSIWHVGPLYSSYIWVLVVLWRRGTTGTEKKKQKYAHFWHHRCSSSHNNQSGKHKYFLLQIFSSLSFSVLQQLKLNSSLDQLFVPFSFSIYPFIHKEPKMFLKQIYTFLLHSYSSFQTHSTLNRSSWSQGLW